jgi:hypothetical protein
MLTMDLGINLVDAAVPVSATPTASNSNSTIPVPMNTTVSVSTNSAAVKPANDTIVSTMPV